MPVTVNTANDTVHFNRSGDLEVLGALGGSMNGAVLMDSCMDSILPVVPTCEELDVGFEIAQGGASARFHRNGNTVQELEKNGQLFTLPVGVEGHQIAQADAQWLDLAQQAQHNALMLGMNKH